MESRFISLVLLICLVIGIVGPVNPAMAAGTSYEVGSTFETSKTGVTKARYLIDATTTSGAAPTELVVPLVGQNPRDVTAQYQDNKSVGAEVIDEGKRARIALPASQVQRWSLSVNYTTDITYDFGSSTVHQVPQIVFSDLDLSSQSVTMAAELSGGPVAIRGPEPSTRLLTTGRQVVTWKNPKGTFNDSVGLVIGESGVAEVAIATTLKNDGWWWQTKTLTLPPDTNQQRVWIDSVSPKPTSISLDADGNVLAKYRLMPKQTLDVTAKAFVQVSNQDYDLGQAGSLDDITHELKDRYLKQTDAWKDSDLAIKAQDDPAKTVSTTFAAVAGEITKPASELTYDNARAAADQLVGELRVQGIPARVVLGKLVNGDVAADWAWTEAYLPGVGWITLDPAQEAMTEGYGQADVRHVGLVLRGINDDFPPEQLADTTVTYKDMQMPEAGDAAPTLSATKYMLLPGLAIYKVDATMPAGAIVDNTGVKIGEKLFPLGSLAPLQTASVRQLALGSQAFSTDTVSYGNLEADSFAKELTSTQNKVSYMLLVAAGGVLLLCLAWKLIQLVKSKRRAKPAHIIDEPIAAENSPRVESKLPLENKDATMSVDELRESVRARVEAERKQAAARRKPPLIQ